MTKGEKARLQTLAKRFAVQYHIMWEGALNAYAKADASTDEAARDAHVHTGMAYQHYAVNCHWAHDQLYELFGQTLGEKPLLVPPEMVSQSNSR